MGTKLLVKAVVEVKGGEKYSKATKTREKGHRGFARFMSLFFWRVPN